MALADTTSQPDSEATSDSTAAAPTASGQANAMLSFVVLMDMTASVASQPRQQMFRSAQRDGGRRDRA